MPGTLLKELGSTLAHKGWTIATAESATAGRLCFELSRLKDSGKIFKGGIVCYDADLKISLLGVEKSLIENYTPESAEVTVAAVRGLSSKIEAEIHIAVTGLTAPGGSETEEKPVGTMFIAVMRKGKLYEFRDQFQGSPDKIINDTIEKIAAMILKIVRDDGMLPAGTISI